MSQEIQPDITNVPSIDAILSEKSLQPSARALILLRVCQFAQGFKPDILDHYWTQLLKVKKHLPGEYKEPFKVLKVGVEPPKSKDAKGFTREILNMIDKAFETDISNKGEAVKILSNCEAQLNKRWWPFGKKQAWEALVRAWAGVDRKAALKLLGKVSPEVQQGIIVNMNKSAPLSQDEWETAQLSPTRGALIIKDIIDEDKPILNLPESLALDIGSQLVGNVNLLTPSETEESKTQSKRDKALQRYYKLATIVSKKYPDAAFQLMENLFTKTLNTNRFKEKWPEHFTFLGEIIRLWASFPEMKDRTQDFLLNEKTGHFRDYILAHWHAMTVVSDEAAADTLNLLKNLCEEKLLAESWFLTTLVRRGAPQTALNLAQKLVRSESLLPRIRRAWMLTHPASAPTVISAEDLKDDVIGQFLLLTSIKEQVEFLREKTDRGNKSLPAKMWSRLNISKVFDQINNKIGMEQDNFLMILYSRNEKKENQFSHYVRMHGYDQYSHEQLDPILLTVLVAWGEEHPAEIESLFEKMWYAMQPSDNLLLLDVIRNSIFERCQTVFPASPKLFRKLFVDYIKSKLVDNSISQREGNQIRTFSLKSFVPFLYCLIGAQKVTSISTKHCEELIQIGLERYYFEKDYLATAASLYSTGKGLQALVPPSGRLSSSDRKEWQLSVVSSSSRDILAMVMEDKKEGNQ